MQGDGPPYASLWVLQLDFNEVLGQLYSSGRNEISEVCDSVYSSRSQKKCWCMAGAKYYGYTGYTCQILAKMVVTS